MSRARDIDAVLGEAVARGDVPGVIAMATDRTGITYAGAFGRLSLDSPAPMTLGTVCWIHSMTKALTAAGCMQLVEQGRIGLDDDCGRWVAALASPRVHEGFDTAGNPLLRPARGAITLRRLLTHTSGFVYDTWNPRQNAYVAKVRLPRWQTFQNPADCLPLDFDPGARWEYGVGIDWAGKVLEAVAGTSLDDYLQQYLLQPLGMTSTGYRLRPEIRARLSGVHQRHPDGQLAAVAFEPAQRPEEFLGGGGMYGTAGDYIRFIRMMLNGGTRDGVRVLSPETVALMGQNHIGDIAAGVLQTQRPAMSGDADFFPGIAQRWGLSFLINMGDVPGRRRAGSLCWAGLRNTYFWIDPKSGVGGTIMMQLLPFADPKSVALYERFEAGVYRMSAPRA
jgi:CubicO group peptidase (beta-lactamase class C family)